MQSLEAPAQDSTGSILLYSVGQTTGQPRCRSGADPRLLMGRAARDYGSSCSLPDRR